MSLKRISITIPPELVEKADEKAADLDRSRSWVLVDALRRYLERPPVGAEALDHEATLAVHEPSVGYAAGLGPSRIAQLDADLRLTAEERVIAAERTAAMFTGGGSAPDAVLSFERYEDYVDWKRLEAARR